MFALHSHFFVTSIPLLLFFAVSVPCLNVNTLLLRFVCSLCAYVVQAQDKSNTKLQMQIELK